MHHNVPAKLAIGAALNLILIIALEVLLLFPCSLPVSTQDLAKSDTRYESCTILSETGTRFHAVFYLVATQSGEIELVPVLRHYIFLNRGKVCTGKAVEILDTEAGENHSFRLGLRSYTVTVSGGTLEVVGGTSPFNSSTVAGGYLLLGFLLTVMELFILDKIKGNA